MTNLAGELFKQLIGAPDIVHIPYKGAAPGVTDLASGPHPDDDAERRRAASAIPRTGKVRILAVAAHEPAEGRARHPDRDRSRAAGHGGGQPQRTVRAGRRAEAIIDALADETRAAWPIRRFQEALIDSGFEPVLDSGTGAAQPMSCKLKLRALDADHQEARVKWELAAGDLAFAAAITRSCASLRSALRSTLLVEASGNSSENHTKRGC